MKWQSGATIENVAKLLQVLCPKHLLWMLYFLKVYPKQSPGCSVVGASSGAVDPKTFKKWVWMFIENIQELVDEVVSILFYLLVLSYRQ